MVDGRRVAPTDGGGTVRAGRALRYRGGRRCSGLHQRLHVLLQPSRPGETDERTDRGSGPPGPGRHRSRNPRNPIDRSRHGGVGRGPRGSGPTARAPSSRRAGPRGFPSPSRHDEPAEPRTAPRRLLRHPRSGTGLPLPPPTPAERLRPDPRRHAAGIPYRPLPAPGRRRAPAPPRRPRRHRHHRRLPGRDGRGLPRDRRTPRSDRSRDGQRHPVLPRPGTPAARLPPLPPRVAKRRSRALATLRQRISRTRLERWIGRRAPGRVLEHGPGGSSVARLENYLPVVLDSRPPLGASVALRVDGARSTYLLGCVVDAF